MVGIDPVIIAPNFLDLGIGVHFAVVEKERVSETVISLSGWHGKGESAYIIGIVTEKDIYHGCLGEFCVFKKSWYISSLTANSLFNLVNSLVRQHLFQLGI
jgi:hypothetical protein